MGGGGQQQQGGGDIMSALGRMMGSSQQQGVSNYQQVYTPTGNNPEGGGGGIGDMFSGGISPGDFHASPFGLFGTLGFGNTPSSGFGQAGSPTAIPTFWTSYPNVGAVPFAVPNTPGGWVPPVGEDLSHHTPPLSSV